MAKKTISSEAPGASDGGFSAPGFLEALAPGQIVFRLWDRIEDTAFWVKDDRSRFVWVNRTLAEQAKAPREAIVGTRDSDWFFPELADKYRADDAAVLASGEPILDKAELVMRPLGGVEWRQTTKYPLEDRGGRIVGTVGMSRPMAQGAAVPARYRDLSRILESAREDEGRTLTVRGLAARCGLSVATLERQTRKHLDLTPRALLANLRMHRAARLLRQSSLTVGEIAVECGYESFSSFSRSFRRRFGRSPGSYRTAGSRGRAGGGGGSGREEPDSDPHPNRFGLLPGP